MGRYYNRKGFEVSREESMACEHHVARDVLPNGRVVSTIFLHINHAFIDYHSPVLFETLVFPSEDNWGELDGTRYCTESEAIEGHAAMVRKWSADDAEREVTP